MRPVTRLTLQRRDFFSEPTPSFMHAFQQASSPRVLGTGEQGKQLFNTGRNSRIIVCAPGDDIQAAINKLHVLGGGTVFARSGTHNVRYNIVLYSNIALIGDNVGSVIDFGGGAYQIQILGANAYSTGTIAIANGDDEVVGSGTTFTAAMVGRSIRLQDFWYEITAFTDATHIDIADPYAGTDLSAASYVIADTISSVAVEGITIQNSSLPAIKVRYFDDVTLNDIFFVECAGALDADDGSSLIIPSVFADALTGTAYDITNCNYGTIGEASASNISAGGAFKMTNGSNWVIRDSSWEAIVGNGATFTGCSDISFESTTVKQITGTGVEFVSGCSAFNIAGLTVRHCSSDGIKLTATSDMIQIYGNNIDNNAGYDINIANANCDDNIISVNNLGGDGTGSVNDSGTNTLIRSNVGVADN